MHSKPRHWDMEAYDKDSVYSQGNQARKWENKFQIHLPAGKGLRYLRNN